MRIWSLHPQYLDTKGLVAVRRETLLAKHVLLGQTTGYTQHPQLLRFRNTADPILYIQTYLYYILQESLARGYTFDATKVGAYDLSLRIDVTSGQVQYERHHLLHKLEQRSPDIYEKYKKTLVPTICPIFCIVAGDVADWEKKL